MKRFLGIASLIALAGLPALAQAAQADGGWIVGLRGGITAAQTDSKELDRVLASKGHSVTTDLDGQDTAGVLSLGYRLSSLTAIEASVGSLGEYGVAATGTTPNPARLSNDLVAQKPAGGRFVGLGLRQDLPLIGDTLALTVRAGLTGWQQKSKINTGVSTTEFKTDAVGWMLGLATTYRLTPAIGLSLGGDWYDQGSHGAIGLLQVGAEYRF